MNGVTNGSPYRTCRDCIHLMAYVTKSTLSILKFFENTHWKMEPVLLRTNLMLSQRELQVQRNLMCVS